MESSNDELGERVVEEEEDGRRLERTSGGRKTSLWHP
jgi:hypothetical protein